MKSSHLLWMALVLLIALLPSSDLKAADLRVDAAIYAVRVEQYGIKLGETLETSKPNSRMWWVKQCCMQKRHSSPKSRACFKQEVLIPIAQNICPVVLSSASR